MDCKQCGQPLPEGTAFCANCGAKQEQITSENEQVIIKSKKGMKKVIEWANKLPKTLPLILIGVYFIVSFILSRVSIGNGTTSLFLPMILLPQCIVVFLLLFGVHQTDKKIRDGRRVNPYGKLILIVFHSVMSLSCISMIIMKIYMAISRFYSIGLVIYGLISCLPLLIYLFAWLSSLLTVFTWETTERITKRHIIKVLVPVLGLALVITVIIMLNTPRGKCGFPKCTNEKALFSDYCEEHEALMNDPNFKEIYDNLDDLLN